MTIDLRAGSSLPRRRPLALWLAAILAAPALHAATIAVTSCDDAGPGTLRDAVAAAVSGDIVDLDAALACTIALTSGALMIADGADGQPLSDIAIVGHARESITIDGGGLDRVFVQDAGDQALLTIRDLSIAHGASDGNGGCINASGNVALEGVGVLECRAGTITGDTPLGHASVRGGGIYAKGAVTLSNSYFHLDKVYGGAAYAYGGGVFAAGSVTAAASTFLNNAIYSDGGASYGGGIAAGDPLAGAPSVVTLTASVITGNVAESRCSFCGARGAGVWAYGNVATTRGEFSANTTSSYYGYGTGGALYFRSFGGPPVTATISGTHFHCNMADAAGAIAAAGDLVVADATFDCNTARNDGGAITLFGGDLAMSGSTLTANVAMGRGGGIFVFGYGDAKITNSTISGNLAAASGGAIANTYGSLHVYNSTINGNRAFATGGGIYFRYPYYTLDLASTIVAGNVSGDSGTDPDDVFPPGLTVGGSHDLIVAAPGVDLPGDTISADPLLQPAGLNGGLTPTQALGEGSPAIDAGSNPLDLPYDQRGIGYVRVYGNAADIGAFEVQPLGPWDRVFANGFDP
jgi:hypothetical protein